MGELTPVWPDAPRRVPALVFPPYRFIPGVHARPTEGHVQFEDAFEAGVDLYHAGYLWEAHEAWEVVYRTGADRELIQGLIQLAAALLKVHMGNERGVAKLYAKSRGHLERVTPAGASTRGIDVEALIGSMDEFFPNQPRRWSTAPRLGRIT